MTRTNGGHAVLFGNRVTARSSKPVTVLCRTGGGRWHEVGTAATYFEAIEVAERSGLRDVKWWFRTAPELAQDIIPGL